MAKPLLYDCDPGQDDAIALILGLLHPSLDIEAITTVGGNVKVGLCAQNAGKILELCDRADIPLYKGAENPIKRDLITLECVFGEDGLAGGENLPLCSVSSKDQHAVDFLVARLQEGPASICATGPLTNLAMAIERDPSITQNIEKLVIMGGCPFPEPLRGEMGNFAPPGHKDKAEYNFAMDPEAAAIILNAPIADITLVGLNVTRAVLYNHRFDQALRRINSSVSLATANILSAVGEEDKEDYADKHEIENDPVRAVHDVVAMAYLAAPEIFETVDTYLQVITEDQDGVPGQTIPHHLHHHKGSLNPIRVATKVDEEKVFELLCEVLQQHKKKLSSR